MKSIVQGFTKQAAAFKSSVNFNNLYKSTANTAKNVQKTLQAKLPEAGKKLVPEAGKTMSKLEYLLHKGKEYT